MALRDYICCAKCQDKLIYDGYDNIREDLDRRFWGDDPEHGYRLIALCERCSGAGGIVIKKALEDAQ